MTPVSKTEIVIIGGGIMGCAAAYFLSKTGHKVTVLERNPGVGLEASGVNSAGVRQQGRTNTLQLAMASVRLWSGLANELGCDLEYRKTGNLKVRFNQPDLKSLEEETEWEHGHGLGEVRMLSKSECQALIPGLTDTIVGGKYCPSDGSANPMLATPAFARAAVRLGAVIRTGIAVTALIKHGNAVCGVVTPQGEIEAELVINTAGPWAGRFNEMAGCQTPIRPQRLQLMVTERLPYKFTPWLGFGPNAVSIVQMKSGNMLMATDKLEVPFVTYQRGTDFSRTTCSSRHLIELLPWLADVRLLRTFSGLTEVTPDSAPYIGALPGISGYLTACGFSGHGFCLGPIIGQTLSGLALGRDPGLPLARFAPERFASMSWPEFQLSPDK